MEKRTLLFCILILFLNNLYSLSALCTEGQIDINKASTQELDSLEGIGTTYAKEIINSRPFNSIDELIDVKGIGQVTLENIKSQGLACVQYEYEKKELNEKENKTIQKSIIVLTNPYTKDIKTGDYKEEKDKNKYAIYGLAGFSILILFLFIIKKYKREKRNEFR